MTEYSLKYIESELGVTLPQAYRQLMTSPEAQETDGWHRGLFTSSVMVVDRTLGLRDLAASYGIPFPSSWICVSEVNGGDSVLMDTAQPDSPLYLWNHETLSTELWDTLARFTSNVE